jgi:drug/metabolite transporter superfamily protein YnfA
MTAPRMIELAAAVAIVAFGVWLYRRRDKDDTYGSQGAVILFVIAAIMAIHALGLFEYRPSAAELEAMSQ